MDILNTPHPRLSTSPLSKPGRKSKVPTQRPHGPIIHSKPRDETNQVGSQTGSPPSTSPDPAAISHTEIESTYGAGERTRRRARTYSPSGQLERIGTDSLLFFSVSSPLLSSLRLKSSSEVCERGLSVKVSCGLRGDEVGGLWSRVEVEGDGCV